MAVRTDRGTLGGGEEVESLHDYLIRAPGRMHSVDTGLVWGVGDHITDASDLLSEEKAFMSPFP